MIMGMDPIILFGIATVSCGALGWLAGPVLGSSAFSVVKRRVMGQINEVCRPSAIPLRWMEEEEEEGVE